MNLKEIIYSVLIVSASESFITATAEMLPPSQYQPVTVATNVSMAKRCYAERSYDFVIVNSPLPDESGMRFSIDCCRSQSTVVLLFARADVYDDIRDKVFEHGVFTLQKPSSRGMMLQAFSWMASARERLRKNEQKAQSFEERMDEIRIINRAKCLLISEQKMTEPEAHRYIEKSSMDNCVSRRETAETVIRLYS